jgi:hypothetical protein
VGFRPLTAFANISIDLVSNKMQGRPKPGVGVICETQSFPRKRESTPQSLGNVLSSDWIPAFAGMTGGSSGSPFQMTPAPKTWSWPKSVSFPALARRNLGDPGIFSFKTKALRKGYWVFGEGTGKSSRAKILSLYLAGA